jgi:hypothetical protein
MSSPLPLNAKLRRLVRVPDTQLHFCVVDVVSRHRGKEFKQSVVVWEQSLRKQEQGEGGHCTITSTAPLTGSRGRGDEARAKFTERAGILSVRR